MSRRDWLKLAVLILLPINAWLCVFYYQKRWNWARMYVEGYRRDLEAENMRLNYLRERHGWLIKQGLLLRFPHIDQIIGKFPPIGRGIPVLFLISLGVLSQRFGNLLLKKPYRLTLIFISLCCIIYP
jgi:hypothetical protein